MTLINENSNSLQAMFVSDVEVSTNDINKLSVILNNQTCSDSFFQSVCNKLSEEGVVFKTSQMGDGINADNSTVITLDMKYNNGNDTLIFAPYNNTRLGYSDSLALAMKTSFAKNGCSVSNQFSNKVGFRSLEEGKVSRFIPTETEEMINENYTTSFVTISLGTNRDTPEAVAASIKEGIARQSYYLDHYDLGTDLIYRSKPGDDILEAANYFSTTVQELASFNDLESLGGETIVNPHIQEMSPFDVNATYSIGMENKNQYSQK